MSWLSFHGRHFFSLIYSHFANFSSKMGKVKVGGDFELMWWRDEMIFEVLPCPINLIYYINALIGGS
jgi:hypothetical protein